MSHFPGRPLDHLVMPTASLAAARARLAALGFTVAPNGVHPFGTENCCVYFSDGTFLEPLAIGDRQLARDAAAQGNMFVARDADFRRGGGDEGFSALVFGTDDASADDAAFHDKGVSAGGMLDFSRPFTDAAGRTGAAAFRLAFAADPHAPDIFFFTCQRINAPKVDRASLQTHANGVTRLSAVVLSAQKPFDHAGIVLDASEAAGAEGLGGASIRVETPNAQILMLAPAELQAQFNLADLGDGGLHARAVVFGVGDLGETEKLLIRADIAYVALGNRLVVAPAVGQGAAFAFEEIA